MNPKFTLKKVIINFSLCYFFLNFTDSKFSFKNYFNISRNKNNNLQCFWGNTKTKSKSNSIELNNLEKLTTVLQYESNNPIEDRLSAVELKNLPGYFISVLDGHGGHQLAEFANIRLYKYFDNFYKDLKNGENSLSEDELIVNSLIKTFNQVESEFYNIAIDLYNKGEGKLATVGSCALISIITPTKIYTAQLGDSKAKLFRRKNENKKLTEYEVVKLSTTHNAEKLVQQQLLKNEFKNDKDIIVCKRPNNKVCYVKGRLQPTRSFGDFHLKYKEFNQFFESKYKRPISNFNGPYIKSNPEIKIVEINPNDEFIVMATDGLWDFLSGKDVAQIIGEYFNRIGRKADEKEIANVIFDETMKKAASEARMSVEKLMNMPSGTKRNLHDDISMIIFNLKH